MSESNFGNYLYIGTGALGIVFNVWILVAIFRVKRLRRKENLLIAALSMFSLIYSLFNLSVGIYRLRVEAFTLISINHCLKLPMTSAVVFAPIGCTSMLFMIALDRLIAAQWFQFYTTLGRTYSIRVICSVFLFSTIFTLIAYLGSIFQLNGTLVSAYCYVPFTDWFMYLFAIVDLIVNSGTILLYIITLFVIWYRSKHAHSSVQALQYKRQRKITIKLSIIIVSLFFLHILPRLVTAVDRVIMNSIILQQVIFTAIGVHADLQVFFYAVIKKELRSEMINIVRCKKLQVSHESIVVTPQPPLRFTNEEAQL